jgi:hypothetical protein
MAGSVAVEVNVVADIASIDKPREEPYLSLAGRTSEEVLTLHTNIEVFSTSIGIEDYRLISACRSPR